MNSGLIIALILCSASLILWLPHCWPVHKKFAPFGIGFEFGAAISFFASGHLLLALIFASLSLYKLLNLGKLVYDRMQPDNLRRSTARSASILTGAQILTGGYAAYGPTIHIATLVYSLAGLQLAITLILLSSTARHLRTTKTLQAATAYSDKLLPTLSVLVPARNETDDLIACLTSLVASTYSKLEIIVLDDCSQTKRTPDIIRSFAHDGVRFIAGQAPSDSWLAKNYAYQQLAEAASGDYLLFCGVDMQFEPGALRELVTTMLEKQKLMLSVLPKNAWPSSLRARLIQPMRYSWELSLPRRLFNRPPVLSSCWMISRKTLESVGSFKATSRSILPESYFAKAAARSDGYSFVRSNMLVSDKSPLQQQATAIRMRYPQLHRRPELVWAVSWLELLCLALPLPTAIGLWLAHYHIAAAMSLAAFLVYNAVLIIVTSVMYGRPTLNASILAPLYDVGLLNYSLYRYEFSTVIWKDRNICLPIMRQQPATDLE